MTKDKLIEQQESANKQYVDLLRTEVRDVEKRFQTQIDGHMLEYEELRTLCGNHYAEIQKLY